MPCLFQKRTFPTGDSKESSTPFPFMAGAIVLRIPVRKPESPAFSTGRESEIGKIKRFEL